MGKILLRTQLSLDNCREHLDKTNSWDTEIESYLTQYVLVIMCSEIQQEIYKVLEYRASKTGDVALKNYAISTCKRVLRSIKKSEVTGFVGYFGETAKEYLNKNINDKDIAIYDNAVSMRNAVAHQSGTNITFRELEGAMEVAKKFICVVDEAISHSIGIS